MLTLATIVATASTTALPLSRLRPLMPSLRVNRDFHRLEVEESALLGYSRGASATPHLLPMSNASVPRRLLGLGPTSPFSSDELIFVSERPLFSPSAAAAIRAEAVAHMAAGARSTFTLTDTNRDVNVHALPLTQRLLNRALRKTLCPLAAACFPSAVDSPEALYVYRALVV
eukprot:6872173-Prymnesium_polylepis.1